MTRPVWIDPEAYAESVSRKACQHCGAKLLTARVGRVMALNVKVDTTPVLDDRWVSGDRLLWCWTGRRLLWRDHKRCGHTTLAEHICGDGDDMNMDDPFGADSSPKKNTSPYAGMIHPVTGKVIGRHSRATNFIKGISDDFGLQQWLRRVTVKGISQDMLEELKDLDVSRNAKRIDEICADAKRAAGGDDAANLGTKLHKQTEYYDLGRHEKIEDRFALHVQAYNQALRDLGIEVIPELVERKVWHTGFASDVTGSFDRIVRLSDGTYAILDVKTGSLDPDRYMEKWLSIAAQLAIYQEAVNDHGVWEPQSRTWTRVPPVRSDYALVAHLPAQGSGCTIYKVDLEPGHWALEALRAVKEVRKTKGFVEPYFAPVGVTVDIAKLEPHARKVETEPADFPFLIDTSLTKAALLGVMESAKSLNCWNEDLAERCRNRLKVIQSRG